jgi:hypothetical protein
MRPFCPPRRARLWAPISTVRRPLRACQETSPQASGTPAQGASSCPRRRTGEGTPARPPPTRGGGAGDPRSHRACLDPAAVLCAAQGGAVSGRTRSEGNRDGCPAGSCSCYGRIRPRVPVSSAPPPSATLRDTGRGSHPPPGGFVPQHRPPGLPWPASGIGRAAGRCLPRGLCVSGSTRGPAAHPGCMRFIVRAGSDHRSCPRVPWLREVWHRGAASGPVDLRVISFPAPLDAKRKGSRRFQ